MRERRNRRNVDDLQCGVRHAFKEHRLGVRAQRRAPLIQIGAVHKRHLNPIAGQDIFQNVQTGPKQRLGRHHVIARLEQRGQRTANSRHARGGGKGILGPLQQRNTLFEHRNGWIAIARIDELIRAGFQKPRLCLLSAVIDKTLGQKDRFADFIVLAAAGTAMHQFGAVVPSLTHLKSSALIAQQKTPVRPSERGSFTS